MKQRCMSAKTTDKHLMEHSGKRIEALIGIALIECITYQCGGPFCLILTCLEILLKNDLGVIMYL